MTGAASIATLLGFPAVLALLAWRGKRRLQPPVVPLSVRASAVLAALYLPFGWLVFFRETASVKAELLGMLPIFPGLIPVSLLVAGLRLGRPPEPIGDWLAAACVLLLFGVAVGVMGRGWKTAIAVGILLAGASAFASFIAYQLVRM